MCKRCGFNPWVGKIPWRRAWQPTPVSLLGESHRQRSLVGYCPWCHRVRPNWNDLASRHTLILNVSATNWHLPRAFASDWTRRASAICLCGNWTLCCCSWRLINTPRGELRVESEILCAPQKLVELVFRWIFSGTDFMIQILASLPNLEKH